MNTPGAPSYEFGPFRLDPAERLLSCRGARIPLTPKVCETLRVLAENAGHVVSKDGLLERVWPDAHVQERSVAQSVFTIRKLLEQHDPGCEYIETVPKVGYRFAAAVSQVPPASLSRGADQPPDRADRSATLAVGPISFGSKVVRIAAGCIAVSVVFGAAFAASRITRPGSTGLAGRFAPAGRLERLTTDSRAVSAAISRDGGSVAYVLDDGGTRSLWVLRLATSTRLRIVAPAVARYDGVTFSPDGGSVYVVRDRELLEVPAVGGEPRSVLSDAGGPVSFAPDGNRLAFVRDDLERGESAVFVANSDGSGQRRIAVRRSPGRFGSVAWSPDGTLLACSFVLRVSDRQMTVGVIPLATGQLAPLSPRTWSLVGDVAWLSDRSGIVTPASERPSEPSQLWMVPYPDGQPRPITTGLTSYSGVSLTADSSAVVTSTRSRVSNLWVVPEGRTDRAVQITSGDSQDDLPAWTRDGRIVYESLASGNRDLWIINADGTDRRQLTFDPHIDTSPRVSPDGRSIVFTSDRNGTHLWTMDIDGTHLRQLTHGSGEVSASFSPDGRWLVYESIGSKRPILEKISIDGGAPRPITDRLSRLPSVSPDGKLVAAYYWNEERDSSTEIAVLPIDGGKPLREFPLTRNPFAQPMSRWKANEGISYVIGDGDVTNVWTRPLDGRPAKPQTEFRTGRVFSFDWSRDGRNLVCSRGVATADVVLLEEPR